MRSYGAISGAYLPFEFREKSLHGLDHASVWVRSVLHLQDFADKPHDPETFQACGVLLNRHQFACLDICVPGTQVLDP